MVAPEEAQHLMMDSHRIGTAAGEKQTDRTGIVTTSSTINEPESPLLRNFASVFRSRSGRNVLVKAAPTGAFVIVGDTDRAFNPTIELRDNQ